MYFYYPFYYLLSLLGLVFLAVLYGSLLHFVLQWLTKKRWPKIYTYMVVLTGLIVWQNSYWGKKSGPEYERIPLGNQLEVRKLGAEPYTAEIQDQDKKILVRTQQFIKTDDNVYGKAVGDSTETYFALSIPTHQVTLLTTEAYDKKVEQANFPNRDQFKSYKANWEGHWGHRLIALLY